MCLILVITTLSFIFSNNAYAYLDPGSGSILFQVLVAIAVFFGIFFRKIKRFFTGKKEQQEEIDSAVRDIMKDKDSK